MKNWIKPLACLLLIYALVPAGRPLSDFLKEKTPFALIITLLCAAVLAGTVAACAQGRLIRGLRAWFFLLLVIAAYTWTFTLANVPEEKFHLLEYAVLGYLIFGACQNHCGAALSFLLAVMLTTAAGWTEEGLQYLCPGRYYDLHDVLINATGGFFGVLLAVLTNQASRTSAD